MVCAGGHYSPFGSCFSCCFNPEDGSSSSPFQSSFTPNVSRVCIYPHGGDLTSLDIFISILLQENLGFYHLVSSHALVSVILNQWDEDHFIACLESRFNLPLSAPPYYQEVEMDISQVLKGYPEVRASYEEEKIKTYGIQLIKNLCLSRHCLDRGASLSFSGPFSFVSALPGENGTMDLWVVGPGPGEIPVEYIHFYGPHFGDRYRIFQTAQDCLAASRISPLAMGCTGASVSLVFLKDQGGMAQRALERGFESP